MIVDAALYRDGTRIPVDCDLSDLAGVRARGGPGDFVWVGLHEPDRAELDQVAEIFGLHTLAVEDAVNAHQRPKLERYSDGLFLVLKTLWYVDATDQVETGEIALFVGADFVVTVRHGEGNALADARRRLEANSQVLAHGPSAVVYTVCDTVVDSYEVVAEELAKDVDEVEESVFSPERTRDANRIYVLKRELGEMRRAVLPLREPVHRMAGAQVTGIHPEAAPYFRDVADHLARVADVSESLDALLSTAFDVHLAQISIQQNDDMRKISAGAALVVVPTLVAGIYGMNFEHMPELQWRFGYAWAVLLMLGAALVLWVFFKRSKWL